MTREESIAKLNQLDDQTLERLAKLSENKTALSYFKNPIKYGALVSFLKM